MQRSCHHVFVSSKDDSLSLCRPMVRSTQGMLRRYACSTIVAIRQRHHARSGRQQSMLHGIHGNADAMAGADLFQNTTAVHADGVKTLAPVDRRSFLTLHPAAISWNNCCPIFSRYLSTIVSQQQEQTPLRAVPCHTSAIFRCRQGRKCTIFDVRCAGEVRRPFAHTP